jgi:hypothetical protein
METLGKCSDRAPLIKDAAAGLSANPKQTR